MYLILYIYVYFIYIYNSCILFHACIYTYIYIQNCLNYFHTIALTGKSMKTSLNLYTCQAGQMAVREPCTTAGSSTTVARAAAWQRLVLYKYYICTHTYIYINIISSWPSDEHGNILLYIYIHIYILCIYYK